MKKGIEIKLKVPTSLSEIKLSTYQAFIKETKGVEDVNLINRAIIKHFCNLDDDLVGKIKKSDYNLITDRIHALLQLQPELKPIISLNGIYYGFIPNIDDITVEEQADIDSNINDVDKWHNVMKVCYRPVKERYNGKHSIEDYKGKDQKEIDVDLETAFSVVFFFINTLKDLLNYIPKYLTAQVKQDKRLLTLVENGVGIKTFTHSLEEAFSALTRSVS